MILLHNMRILIWLVGIILALYGIIATLYKYLYRKFKRFDYKLVYSKFKPKEKIKITFVNEEKILTVKAKIISINDKIISFETKKTRYKCIPSEIKDIRKRGKKFLIALLVVWSIIVLDYIYSYSTREGEICCYEGFVNLETGEVTGGGCGECGRYL